MQSRNLTYQCTKKEHLQNKKKTKKTLKIWKKTGISRRQSDWVCFVLKPPSIEILCFLVVEVLKIGNNKRDNGKLVMLSSLNHFHFQAFFLINKSFVFFQGNEQTRKEGWQKVLIEKHHVLIWASFKNMLITGKGKKNHFGKNWNLTNKCYIFNNHFMFWPQSFVNIKNR